MNRTVLVLLLLALSWGHSAASWETPITVYQPIVTLEGEIVLRPVTYLPHMGSWDPGLELRFTCRANQIETQSGPENRNAASLLGMHVAVDCNPLNSRLPGECQYGDTLRVVLTVPDAAVDSLPAALGLPVDTALVATVECMKHNLRRIPGLRYLTISVVGRPEFARHGGTWNLTALPAKPPEREFIW